MRRLGCFLVIGACGLMPSATAHAAVDGQPQVGDPASDALGVPPDARSAATWPGVAVIRPKSHVTAGGTVRQTSRAIQGFALTKSLPEPRPGQTVTLSAEGSGDIDGTIVSYVWAISLASTNAPEAYEATGPVIEVPTNAATRGITATLTVTDDRGLRAMSKLDVAVTPNLPPKVDLEQVKRVVRSTVIKNAQGRYAPTYVSRTGVKGSLLKQALTMRVVRGSPTTLFANAADADGEVTSYEFDVDGSHFALPPNDPFERDYGLTNEVTFVPQADGKQTFRVSVTDDEGAVTVADLAINVAKPCIQGGAPFSLGPNVRITPQGACVTKKPRGPDDDIDVYKIETLGRLTINNLTVIALSGTFWRHDSGLAGIELPEAIISAVAADGARLELADAEQKWSITPDGIAHGFGGSGWLAGLPIASFDGPARMKSGGFTVNVITALPASFEASPTAAKPTAFTAAMPSANAATRGRAAVTIPPFKIGPITTEIGGVKITQALLTFDGSNNWDMSGVFTLDKPITVPATISAKAGIRDGDFGFLQATADFGSKGVGPVLGIFVEKLEFTLDYGNGLESTCVPNVGTKTISRKTHRDAILGSFLGSWFTPGEIYALYPDVKADYGVPSFQACGAVGFHFAQQVAGNSLLAGTISVGVAEYPDRPSVFRVKGHPLKLLGQPARALVEIYNDGYLNAEFEAQFEFEKVVNLRASLDFKGRFNQSPAVYNAKAFAKVCVLPIATCAAGTVIASSRGIGACLGIDTFLGEWTPGATYVYGGGITPYLQGCELDAVKVAVKDAGNVKYTTLPYPGSAKANVAQTPAMRFEPGEVVPVAVKPGLPGMVVALTGRGRLARFTLVSPSGRRIPVSEVPQADNKLFDRKAPVAILRAPAHGVTNVLVRKPEAGDWKVEIAPESVGLNEVRLSEGTPKPQLAADVNVATEGRRSADLRILDQRAGVVASVYESGLTGGQPLARFALEAGKVTRRTVTFIPAARRREPRDLFVALERNGLPVAILTKRGAYVAPAPLPAGTPKGLDVRRQGASGLQVSWDAVPRAAEYEVIVRLDDGRRLRYVTRTPRLRARLPLDSYDDARVQVRAVSRLGKAGASSAELAPGSRPRPAFALTSGQRRVVRRTRALIR